MAQPEPVAVPLASVAHSTTATHPAALHPRVAAVVQKPAPGRNAFVPMAMVAAAVVVWFGFQTAEFASERQQLRSAQNNLEVQAGTATKIRASLEAIATATAKLAAAGNPTARAIVDELRRRGVTINAPAK